MRSDFLPLLASILPFIPFSIDLFLSKAVIPYTTKFYFVFYRFIAVFCLCESDANRQSIFERLNHIMVINML